MAIDTVLPLKKDDYPRLALILVEALFFGDKRTAQRWGITGRTIVNYRYRLAEDEELSRLFYLKKTEFESNWAKDIPAAIMAGISFLGEAAKQNDYSPEMIHAIAGAVKILAEVGLTKEIIDARIGKLDRPDGEEAQAVESLPSEITEI